MTANEERDNYLGWSSEITAIKIIQGVIEQDCYYFEKLLTISGESCHNCTFKEKLTN